MNPVFLFITRFDYTHTAHIKSYASTRTRDAAIHRGQAGAAAAISRCSRSPAPPAHRTVHVARSLAPHVVTAGRERTAAHTACNTRVRPSRFSAPLSSLSIAPTRAEPLTASSQPCLPPPLAPSASLFLGAPTCRPSLSWLDSSLHPLLLAIPADAYHDGLAARDALAAGSRAQRGRRLAHPPPPRQ